MPALPIKIGHFSLAVGCFDPPRRASTRRSPPKTGRTPTPSEGPACDWWTSRFLSPPAEGAVRADVVGTCEAGQMSLATSYCTKEYVKLIRMDHVYRGHCQDNAGASGSRPPKPK
ncbi:hypothetical protein P4O66_009967, partial [Electrophorus voltai]